MTTSWARSRARSLIIARLTWVRAVARLTTSRSAISSLLRPFADQREHLALPVGEFGELRMLLADRVIVTRKTRSPVASPTATTTTPPPRRAE